MNHRLRDDISYCKVDDRLVFFDVARDRYYQLPQIVERSFVAYVEQTGATGINISALLRHDLLVEAPPGFGSAQTLPLGMPARSAAEQLPGAGTSRVGTILEVFWTLLLTRWELKNLALKNILDSLVRKRRPARYPMPFDNDENPYVLVTEAASIFKYARRFVPLAPTCLLDSIALVRFLSKRNLDANLVFGVTGAPFSAHCWVQLERTVLNDSVGNVASYTPIRVI